MSKPLLCSLFFLFFVGLSWSQEKDEDAQELDSLQTDLKQKGVVIDGTVEKKKVNPLAPSKAAFYSAVLPGLGQVYNRRYWKLPIVYGAIGTGVYLYTYSNNEYRRFRDAFKRRRAGFIDDEFYDLNGSGIVPGNPDFTDSDLQDAQERFQRDRDLALLVTIGLYVLNIVDANVDSHLRQFNVDEDLSLDFRPYLEYHPITADPNYGIALYIKF